MSQLFAPPFVTTLDTNANAISGATLKFYASGTLTPQPVFANATIATSLGPIVTADSAGRFVPIYLDRSVIYRVRVCDAAGTVIRDVDPVTDALSDIFAAGGAALIGYLNGAGVETTVKAQLDNYGATIGVALLDYASYCTVDYLGSAITPATLVRNYDWAPALAQIGTQFNNLQSRLVIRLPAHRIYTRGPLTIRNSALTLKGMGGELSEIIDLRVVGTGGVVATDPLIDFAITTAFVTDPGGHGMCPLGFDMRDVAIKTSGAGATAIRIDYNNSFSNFRPLVRIRNVVIGSFQNTIGSGFKRAIWMRGAWATRLNDIFIEGDPGVIAAGTNPSATPFYLDFAILMENSPQELPVGANPQRGKVGHHWYNVNVSSANTAQRWNGWFEGVYQRGGENVFIGTWLDVTGYETGASARAQPIPGNPVFQVHGTEVDFISYGVKMSGCRDTLFENMYMLKNGGYGLVDAFYGKPGDFFELSRCPGAVISNIRAQNSHIRQDMAGAGVRGVFISDSASVRVTGSTFKGVMTAGVEVSGSDYAMVSACETEGAIYGVHLRNASREFNVGAGCNFHNFPVSYPGGVGGALISPALRLGILATADSVGGQIHVPETDGGENLIVLNQALNTVVHDRRGVRDVSTLTDIKPTESAAEVMTVTNAAPLTILTFTGGFDGHRFALLSTNANTTVTHGAGCAYMHAGVNLVLPTNRPIYFVRINGAYWQETKI